MCSFQRKKKSNAFGWGTCLYSYCLNSELKVEALNGLNLLPPISLEDDISEDKLSDIFWQTRFFIAIRIRSCCNVPRKEKSRKRVI